MANLNNDLTNVLKRRESQKKGSVEVTKTKERAEARPAAVVKDTGRSSTDTGIYL